MSSEVIEYYDRTIKKGLCLYHMTPLNIERNRGKYRILETIPKDQEYTYDIEDSMIFSLTEQFTIYDDSEGLFKHLHFITRKDLRLLHINTNRFRPVTIDYQRVEDMGYDGIISTEYNAYLLVIILHPKDNTFFIRALDHSSVKITDYPIDVDKAMICAYTKECKDVKL